MSIVYSAMLNRLLWNNLLLTRVRRLLDNRNGLSSEEEVCCRLLSNLSISVYHRRLLGISRIDLTLLNVFLLLNKTGCH